MSEDDDADRYWTHSTDLAKGSNKRVPVTTTSPDRAGLDRSNWIRKCAQQILSSYRRDDFADADGYAVQLAIVLERYDDAIIREVTSPITGIQRTCKFPPSIAEFVEFIDEHVRRSTYAGQFDARTREQLRKRAEAEALEKAEPLEYRRKVAERILAEYKAAVMPETKPQEQKWKRFNAEELLAMYSHDARAPAE
jgi:hypothetical protein